MLNLRMTKLFGGSYLTPLLRIGVVALLFIAGPACERKGNATTVEQNTPFQAALLQIDNSEFKVMTYHFFDYQEKLARRNKLWRVADHKKEHLSKVERTAPKFDERALQSIEIATFKKLRLPLRSDALQGNHINVEVWRFETEKQARDLHTRYKYFLGEKTSMWSRSDNFIMTNAGKHVLIFRSDMSLLTPVLSQLVTFFEEML